MIGRLPQGMWAYFIDGRSGILCDNVHCRYFIGAAVGAQRRAAHCLPKEALQLMDVVLRALTDS